MKQEHIHREIIEKCKRQDTLAQYKLYQLYAKAMLNISYRMLNNLEEAEDILQDSFIDAFSKLNSFQYKSTFGAWLKRIVINNCINHMKKKRVELVFEEEMMNYDSSEVKEVHNDQLSVDKVINAIHQLPDGYRVILSLYLLEGYDHTEIKEIMGISESTSKSQYSRARKKLQEILKQEL